MKMDRWGDWRRIIEERSEKAWESQAFLDGSILFNLKGRMG